MATTSELSVLAPIDPASRPTLDEEEKAAPWIVRKLVGMFRCGSYGYFCRDETQFDRDDRNKSHYHVFIVVSPYNQTDCH